MCVMDASKMRYQLVGESRIVLVLNCYVLRSYSSSNVICSEETRGKYFCNTSFQVGMDL